MNGRHYTKETVQPLMKSFDIQVVQLAEGSTFDVTTMTVKTEFPDKEE